MIKTIYLAGPYSGDTTSNVLRALTMAESVSRIGFYPFVPHLFHYWEQLHPHRYDFWMDQDAVWIERCDAFLLYADSPGALKDLDIAMQFDKPIFHSLQQLAEYKVAHV